ncbi:hypothetical protein D3C80_1650530 [compost metagenome]
MRHIRRRLQPLDLCSERLHSLRLLAFLLCPGLFGVLQQPGDFRLVGQVVIDGPLKAAHDGFGQIARYRTILIHHVKAGLATPYPDPVQYRLNALRRLNPMNGKHHTTTTIGERAAHTSTHMHHRSIDALTPCFARCSLSRLLHLLLALDVVVHLGLLLVLLLVLNLLR